MSEKLPKGWKRVKLGEVITLNYGKSLPEKKRIKGNIPVFSSAGITGWHNEPLVNSKGIILGRKGTIGKVYKSAIPFYPIDTTYYILPNEEKYDFNFLFYLLCYLKLEELNEDSAVPGLNRNTAYSQEILLPPLPEQKAIAAVLSSLDDKIDLLHCQNKTLEQMAETLFRKWFIEEAKGNWEEVRLGDVLKSIESGSRPKGGIDPNLKTGVPSIGAENINGLGNFNFSKVKYIPHEYFNRMKRGIVKDYDVLIYKDGAYIGKKSMFGKGFPFDKFCINEHVFILRSNDRISQFFLYFLLDEEELRNLNTNSAQPGLNQTAIKNFSIILPPKDFITKFDNFVKPWIDKIFFNGVQIRTLEQLRDTLLPKLMSGEVRVRY